VTPRLGPGVQIAALVGLLCLRPAPVVAEAACFNDPADMHSGLDIKTACHDNDASSITYTVETYGPFTDTDADFEWVLYTNDDQRYDLVVSVGFEDGRLVAKVEDPNEKEKGRATVSRPAPNSLRLSYARNVLGGVTAYRYNVKAVTDADRNGEADPGEYDLAPDSGEYQHRL
jgi:hypothetical protein